MLSIGEIAPEFKAVDQNGQEVRLADFLGKKNVVLFFYPKDETPGCTAEVCSFRDHYEQFSNLDTVIIGVNQASVATHKSFAERHALNFSILHDEGNAIRKAYRVPNTLFILPGRVTYVIDKQGKIAAAINDMFNAERHIKETLAFLNKHS